MRQESICWGEQSGEELEKNHIANVFSKLHINNRTQAVLQAICKGLVKV